MRLACRTTVWIAAVTACGLSAACSDGTGPGGDLSPEQLESFLQTHLGLVVGSAGFATLQLSVALGGAGIPGVSIVDQGNGRFSISGDVDLNGDGVGDITGNATADVTTDGQGNPIAASIDVQSFTGPNGATASGDLDVQVLGGGGPGNPILGIQSDGFRADYPNAGRVEVEDAGLTLDLTFPANPFLEGFIDFEAGGLSGTLFFEADGLGGWHTRVVGDGFDFIIP